MASFDAVRDITVNGTEAGDGTLTLISEGLQRHKLPELEIVGITEPHARHGAIVINHVANYMANEKKIAPGELIGISSPHGSVIARLVASPDAPKKTGLGKLFGGSSPARLRIVEPLDDMEPLRTLLTTVMLWKANAALDSGDVAVAIDILESAIEFFPGDPARRESPRFGMAYNWQNHMAYRLLAQVVDDPDESAAVLQHAIDRDAQFEIDLLGDAVEDIAKRDPASLTARANTILDVNQRVVEQMDINEHVLMHVSPIWRAVEDEADTGRAGRRMSIVPRGHVYSGAALVADPTLVAIAIELVAAAPARAAALFADTVAFWDGGSDEAPLLPVEHPYEPGDQLLSTALAHVARLLAAGMSAGEIRAHCGLDSDAMALATAREKFAELETREGEAQMRAISGDVPA